LAAGGTPQGAGRGEKLAAKNAGNKKGRRKAGLFVDVAYTEIST
jgi:hypothetical protein